MRFPWLGTLLALGLTAALPAPSFADDDDEEEDDDDDDDDDDYRRPTVKLDPKPAGQLAEAIAARKQDAVAALLAEDVEQDIAFTNRECAGQFPRPSVVGKDQLQAFARCLATLDVRTVGRPTLWMFGPGIELEVRAASNKVFFIGSHFKGTVMLTAQALESLRAGGSSNLDEQVGKPLELIVKRRNAPVGTWMRVCLAPNGELADVRAEDSLSNIGGPFVKAAKETWKFRAFELGGAKRAACAFTHVAFPTGSKAHVTLRPAKTVTMPPSVLPPQNIAPQRLEENRLGGEKNIVPDDRTKRAIKKDKKDRIVGSWKLCLDTTGAVMTVKALKGTGYPDYDKKIEKAMAKWKYKPFLIDGRAAKVCTAVTFIYQQK